MLFKLREYLDQFVLHCPVEMQPNSNYADILGHMNLTDMTWGRSLSTDNPNYPSVRSESAHIVMMFDWDQLEKEFANQAQTFYNSFLSMDTSKAP